MRAAAATAARQSRGVKGKPPRGRRWKGNNKLHFCTELFCCAGGFFCVRQLTAKEQLFTDSVLLCTLRDGNGQSFIARASRNRTIRRLRTRQSKENVSLAPAQYARAIRGQHWAADPARWSTVSDPARNYQGGQGGSRMICEACCGNGYEKLGKRCGACHGSGEKISRDGRRRSECLMRAHNIITQTDHVHGEAMETLANTAALWSVIFKIPVRPDQVASAMEAHKMARRVVDPTNKENWDDAAGYVGLGAEAVVHEN